MNELRARLTALPKTSIRDGSPTGRFVVDWLDLQTILAALPAPADEEEQHDATCKAGQGPCLIAASAPPAPPALPAPADEECGYSTVTPNPYAPPGRMHRADAGARSWVCREPKDHERGAHRFTEVALPAPADEEERLNVEGLSRALGEFGDATSHPEFVPWAAQIIRSYLAASAPPASPDPGLLRESDGKAVRPPRAARLHLDGHRLPALPPRPRRRAVRGRHGRIRQ